MKNINLSQTWATKADALGMSMLGLHGSWICWFKRWIILTVLTLFILLPKILCLRVRNITCEQHRSERTELMCSLKSKYTSLGTWHNFNQNGFAVLLDIAHNAQDCPFQLSPVSKPGFQHRIPGLNRWESERTRNRPNLLKWTIARLRIE